MKRYLGEVVLLTLVTCIGVLAQADNPELVSANIPYYPPLARQARVFGVVKVAFTLPRTQESQPTLKLSRVIRC